MKKFECEMTVRTGNLETAKRRFWKKLQTQPWFADHETWLECMTDSLVNFDIEYTNDDGERITDCISANWWEIDDHEEVYISLIIFDYAA